MNTLARGKRLSSMITGTFGLLGIIGATALGLHTWADIEATKSTDVASSETTASGTTPSDTSAGTSTDSSSTDATTDDTTTDSGISSPTSDSSHATTSGS